MEHSEVCVSDREFPVGMRLVFEDQAMARAVHGLQALSFDLVTILLFQQIEIILVIFVVSRHFPQVDAAKVGRYDFLIASASIFVSHEIHELVVNFCTVWEKERATRSMLTKEEKVLVWTDKSMVPLQSLLFQSNKFIELRLLRERDSVNSLQRFSFRIAEPIGLRAFHDFQGLDVFR